MKREDVDHETSLSDRLAEARRLVARINTHGRPARLDFFLATGAMVVIELLAHRFNNRVTDDPAVTKVVQSELNRIIRELTAEHDRLGRLAELVPEYTI